VSKRMREPEAAEYLGVTPKTLQFWRWKKRGPRYMKLANRVYYNATDLDAYEKSRWVGTKDQPVEVDAV